LPSRRCFWRSITGSLTRAFFLGLTTGVIYFTGTLYWVTRVMVVYGASRRRLAVLVNAALIVTSRSFGDLRGHCPSHQRSIRHDRDDAAPLVWVRPSSAPYLLTGFPWVLLGYSQARVSRSRSRQRVGVYGCRRSSCS